MSKIRIIRYQADHSVISDRLVESGTEFAQGPGETHTEGPMRIDFLMENQAEVTNLVAYLQQLSGLMPLSEKQAKIPKTSQKLEKNTLEQLVADCIKKNKSQEDLLDYLRNLNFTLVTSDHWLDICQKNEWKFNFKPHSKTCKPLHKDYQYMVRQLRVAKDPANDKFDPSIVFALKLISPKVEKYHIYEAGEFKKTVPLEWKDKGEINFKVKEKFYKFPAIMTYEERSKWRLEDRKVQFTAGYIPTQFYTKYKDHVTILQPIKK